MSNSFLIRNVPKYSKHKASGRAYARFNGRCIYFGRFKSMTAVIEKTLAKARRTVKFLLTPKQLLTLVGMKEHKHAICVLPPPVDADQNLLSVLIHPDDVAHAAEFLPQTCGGWLLSIKDLG